MLVSHRDYSRPPSPLIGRSESAKDSHRQGAALSGRGMGAGRAMNLSFTPNPHSLRPWHGTGLSIAASAHALARSEDVAALVMLAQVQPLDFLFLGDA